MAASVRGRSTMALYSSETSLDCHRVRFVLAEKSINVDIVNVTVDESAAADLAELNPYNQAPTLVDRDLVLYDAGVINDYLDERYPHPPLMPVDPVVNDHLGDVYWSVGRKTEARFQWTRALSFIDDPESSEADPDRIRAKLERGLDAVLEEEGADPIQVADGN